MGHDHHHESQGNIKVAFFLNLAFTLLEIVGGFWTNSMAILSDALHDMGDSLALGIAWYLEKYAKRGPDQQYSFGYARFSLLGAMLNSLILVGGSVLILVNAVPRIFKPQPVNSQGMLIFAILGIIINGAAVLRLRRGKSLNERVVLWHLLEDVLGWAVILIASVVLMFVDLPVLDPVLSVLITIYVLYHVVRNLKDILRIFLQGVPKDLSITEIEQQIAAETNILSAHHTHVWSLEGERNLLSIHIVVRDDTERQEIIAVKQRIRDLMLARGIEHVTIETEFACEDCRHQPY